MTAGDWVAVLFYGPLLAGIFGASAVVLTRWALHAYGRRLIRRDLAAGRIDARRAAQREQRLADLLHDPDWQTGAGQP